MGKDPVCRGDVDESSPWSTLYEGRTYYFNSAECKADFDRDPGKYSAAEYPGAAHEAGANIKAGTERTASRARGKIESMISERKNKAAEQIGTVSNAFRSVSQQLRDQKQEAIARYADKAAANVDLFSGYLQQHDAQQIMNEAENFVRRRPGWMIGGALAAGFLMARFLKSSKSVSA